MIDISKLELPDVLKALYDAARTQGMGIIHYTPGPMTKEEAIQLLESGNYFDYVKGRVMKVKLEGTEFNESLYDRDNGSGAAAAAIEPLR